jgi:hypothetical protein
MTSNTYYESCDECAGLNLTYEQDDGTFYVECRDCGNTWIDMVDDELDRIQDG